MPVIISRAMPLKPIRIPPATARRCVEDTRAFYAEPNPIKRDEIAGQQLCPSGLPAHRAKKLRLAGIKEVFKLMRS